MASTTYSCNDTNLIRLWVSQIQSRYIYIHSSYHTIFKVSIQETHWHISHAVLYRNYTSVDLQFPNSKRRQTVFIIIWYSEVFLELFPPAIHISLLFFFLCSAVTSSSNPFGYCIVGKRVASINSMLKNLCVFFICIVTVSGILPLQCEHATYSQSCSEWVSTMTSWDRYRHGFLVIVYSRWYL